MEGPFAQTDGHEQILFTSDPETGLRAIIAIHSTALGPALGGTRCYAYADEAAALADVLRLSRAMTYKAACAGLDLGGGKAVIIGDPATATSEAALRAYGRAVESLGGRYVTACDVGTTPADLAVVSRETRWATGALTEEGGSGDSGLPTALGTYVGIGVCAERVWGDASLGGRHIAVQGIGKVGRALCEHLHAEGAKLTVADVSTAATDWAAEHVGADVVDVADIALVDCDILSPNALGGIITVDTVSDLTCAVVAGAANNQLATPDAGVALHDAGILYAPDYLVNAGGLISVSDELHAGGWDAERVDHRVRGIGDRLRAVFDVASAEGIGPASAAALVAERRIAALGRLRRFWLPPR